MDEEVEEFVWNSKEKETRQNAKGSRDEKRRARIREIASRGACFMLFCSVEEIRQS